MTEYLYPWFESQLPPTGFLLPIKACHACWFYYLLADKASVTMDQPIHLQILEHGSDVSNLSKDYPLWTEPMYFQQARAVAMIYQLNSPTEFLAFWPQVTLEAARIGTPAPQFKYMNPIERKPS